jgi:hypothetical protein
VAKIATITCQLRYNTRYNALKAWQVGLRLNGEVDV